MSPEDIVVMRQCSFSCRKKLTMTAGSTSARGGRRASIRPRLPRTSAWWSAAPCRKQWLLDLVCMPVGEFVMDGELLRDRGLLRDRRSQRPRHKWQVRSLILGKVNVLLVSSSEEEGPRSGCFRHGAHSSLRLILWMACCLCISAVSAR